MTVALALPDLLPGVLHEYGVDLPPDMPFEQWRRALVTAEFLERASPWFLVDLISYGRATYGEDYSQALPTDEDDPQGVRQSKLKQAAWMGSKFPPNTRVTGLTYTHHRAVAELEPEDRQALLREALDESLSTRELIDRVKDRRQVIRLEAIGASVPACAADRSWQPTKDDLLPEWQRRLEAAALDADTDDPRGFVAGYLRALVDTGSEACFQEGRWQD